MRRVISISLAFALLLALASTTRGRANVAAAAAEEPDPCGTAAPGLLCAGAASVDTTWHVGGGQGQLGTAGNGLTSNKFDPFHHTTKMEPSDGLHSRQYTKALVVQGPDGTKVAVVKTDSYLQQDVLTRRVAQLVSGEDPVVTEYAVPGLPAGSILLASTHNHSAPYYTSTAWGTWLFTDVIDARMFEATARNIAQAVRDAHASLQPARLGAASRPFDDVQRNVIGRSVADDGTPAGFPRDHFDPELAVVRVEALDGQPIAALVNFGMHPESIDGTDLTSADFVGVVEREVERGLGRSPGAETGPVVVWTQGSVGDVEPDQMQANPPGEGTDYWRKDYQQMEHMSRKLAAAVLGTWSGVDPGSLSSEPVVAMADARFAGPVFHPVPTVTNCRSDQVAPPIGVPDCQRVTEGHDHPHPVPDNVGSPAYGAVHESLRIHLQAIRLGDVLLATCPCEPISDMVLNLKSRANAAADDMVLGHEYPCTEPGVTPPVCDFRDAEWRPEDLRPVDAEALALMRAQIRNDAAGWEDDAASLGAESEPEDPAEIKGNFTHAEIQDLVCGEGPCEGYRLPLMVGQANDYIGYVVTYREYSRGDHYRKALTAFGPHTSDYVNTRLVAMAAALQGGALPADAGHGQAIGAIDEVLQQIKSAAVGAGGELLTGAIDAAAPADGGTAGVVQQQPATLERFGAATFRWLGGSNWTDNPVVTVERLEPEGWRTVATQEGGEIVVTLGYGQWTSSAPVEFLAGRQLWEWTATWEVFERTPPGTYRFTVEGAHRSEAGEYVTASDPFDVSVWTGISAHGLTVEPLAATASFDVSGVERTVALDSLETDDDTVLSSDEVHYPDTYEGGLPYISGDAEARGPHRICYRCSFRSWADTGRVTSATVTVRQTDGVVATYPATLEGDQWLAAGLDVADGDVVVVEPSAVVDEHGNVNGAPSEEVVVSGAGARLVDTSLTYTGDTSGAIGRRARVAAVLTTAAGEPFSGATVTFARGNQHASAVTGTDGVAVTDLRVTGPAGDAVPLTASYEGDATHRSAEIEVPFTATAGGRNGLASIASTAGTAGAAALALAALTALFLLRRHRKVTA